MEPKSRISIIIPLAIPSTGKTTVLKMMAKELAAKGYAIRSVSSDAIRGELMEK
jgi:hypothetical protein